MNVSTVTGQAKFNEQNHVVWLLVIMIIRTRQRLYI